jgi:hypothetical protein
MSNLLAMPLVTLAVTTGTNEDWISSIKYVVDDGSGVPESELPQFDLSGIKFDMEVRRRAEDHEVVIRASSDDGSLAIGEPPDFGFFLINVPYEKVKILNASSYVADIVGIDEIAQRRVMIINITLDQGITRP